MLRCAITDRRMFAGGEAEQEDALVVQVRRLAQQGVEFLQMREKDLAPEAVLRLASRVRAELPAVGGTRLLINCGNWLTADGPPRQKTAWPAAVIRGVRSVGAHGVHLPGGWTEESLQGLRAAWERVGAELDLQAGLAGKSAHDQPPTVAEPLLLSVACHHVDEVRAAVAAGADLLLFSPVFGKLSASGAVAGMGLERLREAVLAAGARPVFALGGVTRENAPLCVAAGAAGVAGIRLFARAE